LPFSILEIWAVGTRASKLSYSWVMSAALR
jgi:hypothetical protein